jgi:hypothetical protein
LLCLYSFSLLLVHYYYLSQEVSLSPIHRYIYSTNFNPQIQHPIQGLPLHTHLSNLTGHLTVPSDHRRLRHLPTRFHV